MTETTQRVEIGPWCLQCDGCLLILGETGKAVGHDDPLVASFPSKAEAELFARARGWECGFSGVQDDGAFYEYCPECVARRARKSPC